MQPPPPPPPLTRMRGSCTKNTTQRCRRRASLKPASLHGVREGGALHKGSAAPQQQRKKRSPGRRAPLPAHHSRQPVLPAAHSPLRRCVSAMSRSCAAALLQHRLVLAWASSAQSHTEPSSLSSNAQCQEAAPTSPRQLSAAARLALTPPTSCRCHGPCWPALLLSHTLNGPAVT